MSHTKILTVSRCMLIHRITIWLRLEGTSGDHLVQSLCSKQGRLEWVAQVCVHSSFEHLQESPRIETPISLWPTHSSV